MTPIHLLLGSLLAVSPIPQAGIATPTSAQSIPARVTATPVFDEDPPPRLSLPTESDRELWRKPGFRFGLGLVYGRMYGINGPPSAKLIGPTIRMGIRLDESWSLMGSFQYLFAFGKGGMGGARYAGTIEPTWHATAHLNVGVGIGFGGLVDLLHVGVGHLLAFVQGPFLLVLGLAPIAPPRQDQIIWCARGQGPISCR